MITETKLIYDDDSRRMQNDLNMALDGIERNGGVIMPSLIPMCPTCDDTGLIEIEDDDGHDEGVRRELAPCYACTPFDMDDFPENTVQLIQRNTECRRDVGSIRRRGTGGISSHARPVYPPYPKIE